MRSKLMVRFALVSAPFSQAPSSNCSSRKSRTRLRRNSGYFADETALWPQTSGECAHYGYGRTLVCQDMRVSLLLR